MTKGQLKDMATPGHKPKGEVYRYSPRYKTAGLPHDDKVVRTGREAIRFYILRAQHVAHDFAENRR